MAYSVAIIVVYHVAKNVAFEILYSYIVLLWLNNSLDATKNAEIAVPAQPLSVLWGAGTHYYVL